MSRSILFIGCIFFILHSHAQIKLDWVKGISGNNTQTGEFIVGDSIGNIYVTGMIESNADFTPSGTSITYTSLGYYDIYVSKYDSIGNLLWVKFFGGPASDVPYYTTLDASGNIFIGGSFGSTVDFDPSPALFNLTSFGQQDCFILILDESGNFIDAKQFGGTGNDEVHSIQIDDSSNIVIAGVFCSTVDFNLSSGIFNLTATGVSWDMFVVKYSPFFDFKWAFSCGNSGSDIVPRDIKINNYNIFVTGEYKNTIDFDPLPSIFTLTSSNNSFLAKYDYNGNLKWAKNIGEGSFCKSDKMKFNTDLNAIYLSGELAGLADLDPGIGTNFINYPGSLTGGMAFYVAKYDTLGNFIWAQGSGNETGNFSESFAIDANENIYLTGNFQLTVDFNPTSEFDEYTANPQTAYVTSYTKNGEYRGTKVFEGNSFGLDIFINPLNDIFVSGYHVGSTDFDPSIADLYISSSDGYDVFIGKYNFDPCAAFITNIDTASSISCSLAGYAASHAYGGTYPFSYQWNTIPVTTDSIVNFDIPGNYLLTVTDSIGCIANKTLHIDGPVLSGYDLGIVLICEIFRPGISSEISLVIQNNGCDSISGNIMIVLDSNLTYDSSSIVPYLVSGDTLLWNFYPITYDSSEYLPIVYVTTDSTANIGDSICLLSIISPLIGDFDSTNNIFQNCYTVVNSFDPNDKQVYPQGVNANHGVLNNQNMTYTVRFQNTGTAPATNVYIIDTLDANLDLNSVRIVASSHYMFTEVLPGNVLKFRFDNINLPDSTNDEPNSHGYVIYEIDQLPNLPHNTLIENTAAIYFDYNEPVITNTVFNTIDLGATITASANNFCGADSSLLTLVPNVPGLQGNWQWFANTCSGTPIGNGSSIWVYPSTTTNYFVKDSSGTLCFSHTINVTNLDNSVNQSVITLTSNQNTGTYQWLNCDSIYAPVSGETGQVFTATMNGNYAVIISDNGCVDTSACYLINSVGVLSQLNGNLINVYPNPVNTQLNISFSSVVNDMSLSLSNIAGQVLINRSDLNGNNFIMETNDLAAGVYYLKILEAEKNVTIKVIKQ